MCKMCGNETSCIKDESILCEIHEQDLASTNGDLNNFILHHQPTLDAEYKCNECKTAGNCVQKKALTMVPEVFIILYKKFKKKWIGSTPAFLSIPTFGEKTMVYRLVSQSQHSGGQNGGHYWSVSNRRGGVYMLNDSSCEKVNSNVLHIAKPESYLLWYHFSHYE